MKPGPLVNESGHFKDPNPGGGGFCEPWVSLGPYLLMGPGKLKAHILGTPAVQGTWSLGNFNTGLHIYFEPFYRDYYGKSTELLSLVGDKEHNDLTGEAEWDRPGRLYVAIAPPRWAAPLSGGCFDQSWEASVDIIDVHPTSPALSGDLLYIGDQIKTGGFGAGATIQTSGGGLLSLGPNSDMSFEAGVAAGTPQLDAPEYKVKLSDRVREFANANLPMPQGYNANTTVDFWTSFRDGTLEDAYNRIKDIQDPCEAAVVFKLFMDGNADQWTAANAEEKAGSMAVDIIVWTWIWPNEWNVLDKLAEWTLKPIPVFGVIANIKNTKATYDRVMKELADSAAVVGAQRSLDAFEKSRGWTPDQIKKRTHQISILVDAKEEEMRQARNSLESEINRLENELINVGCYDPLKKIQKDDGFCSTQFADYDATRRSLENQHATRVRDLMAEILAAQTEKYALETYRAPLAMGNCEAIKVPPPASGFDQPCPVRPRLNSGRVRQVGPGSLSLNDNQIVVEGTEFIAEQDGEISQVKVVEGAVKITTAAGQQLLLEAGQQIELPAGTVTDFDVSADDGGLVDGLPLRDLLVDDEPQPYGPVEAIFADISVPAGWLWEDPGNDSKLETPEPGALRITVPVGNDFWGSSITGPRLLHKVTGDFELEGELLQQSRSLNLAITEFLFYSPGSYLGALADQMQGDGLLAHYRGLGGGWLRFQGLNKLVVLGKSMEERPDALDKPVWFRLTRHGDMWRTYWSIDEGQTWNLSGRQEIIAADTLWVGWLFKRVDYDGLPDEPAVNTLRQVRLNNAPRDTLPQPDWDLDTWAGGVQADAQTVRLTLDTSRKVRVAALSTQPLAGDFDVSITLDAAQWPAERDQERAFRLFANTLDDKNTAYVGVYPHPGEDYYRLDSDIKRDGRYGSYALLKAGKPDVHLRLARQGDKFSAYGWLEGEWMPIGAARDGFEDPVYLEVSLDIEGKEPPLPLDVTVTVEDVATGALAGKEPWLPADLSVFERTDLPPALSLPAGVTAAMFQSPFDLRNLFLGRGGDDILRGDDILSSQSSVFAFSYVKDRQKLVRLDASGVAWKYAESELLAGFNKKAGVLLDSGILMTIDGWLQGGNSYSGLFQLEPEGTFRQWALSKDYGGLTDLIEAPQGGWYFCDFEADNVWHLPGEGQSETPLITSGDVPPGLVSLAVDESDNSLYALNQSGEWPAGGTPGVYRITPDGQAQLVLKHPADKNFDDIAYNRGGAFPAGLYVSDSEAGSILRMDPSGATTPVLTGLTNPTALDFGPGGDLVVVCDAKYVLWCGIEAPPSVPAGIEQPTPAAGGQPVDASATGVPAVEPSPAPGQATPDGAAGLGFSGSEGKPEPEATPATSDGMQWVQPTTAPHDTPAVVPQPTPELPLPVKQPGIAGFTAAPQEAAPGQKVTLSWQTTGGQPYLFRVDAAGQPQPEGSDVLMANGSVDVLIDATSGDVVTFRLGLLSPEGDKWLDTANVTVNARAGLPPLPPLPPALPTVESTGIFEFTAAPETAMPDQTVILSWRTGGGQPLLYRLDARGQPQPQSSDVLPANGSMAALIDTATGDKVTFVLALQDLNTGEWLATDTLEVKISLLSAQ